MEKLSRSIKTEPTTYKRRTTFETGDAKFQAISGEIEQISNDASFDISEELIVWDELKYAKGVGTRIAGQDSDIEDIHRRLVIAVMSWPRPPAPYLRVLSPASRTPRSGAEGGKASFYSTGGL